MAPNRVWVSDFTFLWTTEGWVYLAIVLDLYSRRIVGCSLSNRMTKELVIEALEMKTACMTDSSFVQGQSIFQS